MYNNPEVTYITIKNAIDGGGQRLAAGTLLKWRRSMGGGCEAYLHNAPVPGLRVVGFNSEELPRYIKLYEPNKITKESARSKRWVLSERRGHLRLLPR